MVNNITQTAPQAQQRVNNFTLVYNNSYKHDVALAKKLVQNMNALCLSLCDLSRVEPIDDSSNHSGDVELQAMQSTAQLQSSNQQPAEFLPLAINQMLLNHKTNQGLLEAAPKISIFTNHLNKSYEHEALTELILRNSPENRPYVRYLETEERIRQLPILLQHNYGGNRAPSIYRLIKEAAFELNEVANEDGEVNSENLGVAISKYAPSLKLLIKNLSAEETAAVIKALIKRHCLFHMAQYIFTENSEKLSENNQVYALNSILGGGYLTVPGEKTVGIQRKTDGSLAVTVNDGVGLDDNVLYYKNYGDSDLTQDQKDMITAKLNGTSELNDQDFALKLALDLGHTHNQKIRDAFEETFSPLRRKLKGKVHDKVTGQVLSVLGFIWRRSFETQVVGVILTGLDPTPTSLCLLLMPIWTFLGAIGVGITGLPALVIFCRVNQIINSDAFWDQLPLSREQAQNYFSIKNNENFSTLESVAATMLPTMIDDVPEALDRV